MSSFSKYTMIEKGELDRLRQKQVRDYNPQLMTLANLKDKMDAIISNNKLSSIERTQLFNVFMTTFENMKSNAPLGISSTPVESVVNPEPIVKSETVVPMV